MFSSSTNIDARHFTSVMIGAIAVIIAVIIKNGNTQLIKHSNVELMTKDNSKMVGTTLFVLGWALVAYTLGVKSSNPMMIYLTSAAIVGAVMMMMNSKESGQAPMMMWPVIFAVGWISLGYFSSMHSSTNFGRTMGMVAPVLVLLSMMLTLPYQRENCMVDGPGMALFALGWVALAIGNTA